MSFRVYHHADLYAHPVRPGHPERPHRVAAILQGFAALEHPGIEFKVAPVAPLEAALMLHDEAYVAELARPFEPGERARKIDEAGETLQAPDSLDAALGAVGALCEAVDDTVAGRIQGSLTACRPAGHHACKSDAMGFCLLGGAALAAKHAQVKHGMRVAVLDFDVHHGNGTENLLWDEKDILFASTHEGEAWPKTGEIGDVGAHGHFMNRPLPSHSGEKEALLAWNEILEGVRKFAPDLIVVSAGFDAHVRDPLATLRWPTAVYQYLGQRIHALAAEICGGRVVHVAEGGYDLHVLRHEALHYFAPFLEQLTPAPEGAHLVPYLIGPAQGGNPSPYLVGNHPLAKGAAGKFAVTKAVQRIWVQNQETGAMLYTAPDFIRLHSREPLEQIAQRASEDGYLDPDDIIDLEAQAPRGFGYF